MHTAPSKRTWSPGPPVRKSYSRPHAVWLECETSEVGSRRWSGVSVDRRSHGEACRRVSGAALIDGPRTPCSGT